ncbi:MAG: AgmX/PglI C-terminal domain-containing protein [Myxococcales bacterium]|nr:AgmX/PglI C-terminal domain-containing protein [Myxococcales bacterium]
MSSQSDPPTNTQTHQEPLAAERDEALREQGRLLAQIEDLNQRLQQAEWYRQHLRLGWLWMSLLLLFGVTGYWRGYMQLAPPQPAAAYAPPTMAQGNTSRATPTAPQPTPPQPAPTPRNNMAPPTAQGPTPQPTQITKRPAPTAPTDPSHNCPEGMRYRCLRVCHKRDARKRCIDRALQPTCQCWKVRKQGFVKLVSLQGNGPISQQRLQRATKQRLPFLQRCYRRMRNIRPAPPEGELKLRFNIPSFGRPQHVEIVSSALNNPTLHNCLIRQIQRLRFRPNPDPTPTNVSLLLAMRFQFPPAQAAPPRHTMHMRKPRPTGKQSVNGKMPAQACPTGKIWRCAKPCYQYDEKGYCLAPGTRVKCRCMRPDQRP